MTVSGLIRRRSEKGVRVIFFLLLNLEHESRLKFLVHSNPLFYACFFETAVVCVCARQHNRLLGLGRGYWNPSVGAGKWRTCYFPPLPQVSIFLEVWLGLFGIIVVAIVCASPSLTEPESFPNCGGTSRSDSAIL